MKTIILNQTNIIILFYGILKKSCFQHYPLIFLAAEEKTVFIYFLEISLFYIGFKNTNLSIKENIFVYCFLMQSTQRTLYNSLCGINVMYFYSIASINKYYTSTIK